MAHRSVNKRMAAAACRAYLEKKLQTNAQHVRIYTDASYNSQKKVGAIAYVIIDNNKVIEERSEAFTGRSNSTYLELLAIRNALVAAKSRFVTKPNFVVISDCKSVVDSINRKASFNKKLTNFQELVSEVQHNYIVSCEYTKAHCHKHTSDSKYNRRVDMLARKTMKEETQRYEMTRRNYDNIRLNVVVNSQ